MNEKELKKVWNKFELSCRASYKPSYVEKFCKEIGIEFPKKLIYTRVRYRELSKGKPRVDAEDLLIYVCKKFNIKPNQDRLALSSKMFGEGSRRQLIEEAYFGVEK